MLRELSGDDDDLAPGIQLYNHRKLYVGDPAFFRLTHLFQSHTVLGRM